MICKKSMGAMMSNTNGMMESMTDPALKARMQKMHEQMAVMMVNMQKMNGTMGMMGGGMMQGKGKAQKRAASCAACCA